MLDTPLAALSFLLISGLRVSPAIFFGLGLVIATLLRTARMQLVAGWSRALDYFRPREQAVLFFVCAVGLIPALYFASWVHRYGVAVPKFDDWDVATLISKAHSGQLSLGDLFAQQQEGRTILPKLLFLLSTIRGGWDVRNSMALSVPTCTLTAVGIFLLLRQSRLSVFAVAICGCPLC